MVFGWSFEDTSRSGSQKCSCNACSWGSVQLMLALVHVSIGKSSFAGTDVISLQGVSTIGQ